MLSLQFSPVDVSRWDDFQLLFDGSGGPKYCWCMVWRATSEEGRNTKGPVRKQQMRQRIQNNVPVGLLAYDGTVPVGWVSIAPRQTYRRLGGETAEQNETIWSLACMFIKRPLRGRGLAHQLIAAAVDHARENGATLVEAYPVAPDAPSYRFMGFVPAFETAGFSHCGMAGKRRHIMRLELTGPLSNTLKP